MRGPAPGAKFNPGRIALTPGAVGMLGESGQHIFEFLQQFVRADWGETNRDYPQDAAWNDPAMLAERVRIVAGHKTTMGRIICPVTYKHGDDSETTCMLPEES